MATPSAASPSASSAPSSGSERRVIQLPIERGLICLRGLSPRRLRFELEYGLERGTSANSFLFLGSGSGPSSDDDTDAATPSADDDRIGTVAALLIDPRLAILPGIAFLLQEWRAKEPVFPRTRAGRGIAILCGTAGIAFTGADGMVPLGLQVGLGWPILVAALPLVATTGAWAGGSFVSSRLPFTHRQQMLLAGSLTAAGVLVLGAPLLGGGTIAIGIVIAAFGMGIQSPVALLSAAAERPGGEGRATASVPLARSIGGGIGIAAAGAIVVGRVGEETLSAAKDIHTGVPAIADAVQHANLVLALISLACLPAVLLLRRD